MKTWNVWVVSPHTGDCKYIVAQYNNRGHAIAKLRGLNRAAWRAASEMQYAIRKG